MYCMNCGKELPDEAKFCVNCGAKISKMLRNIGAEENSCKDIAGKFANNSEWIYIKSSNEASDSIFECVPFDRHGAVYDGKVYIPQREVVRVYERKTDKSYTITSTDKNFVDAIAVNCHGIFRRKDRDKYIYLFDFDGKLKKKIKPNAKDNFKHGCVPLIYIFDNYLYSVNLKVNNFIVYKYDFINEVESTVFDFSEYRERIYREVNNRVKYTVASSSCVRYRKICANDDYAVIAFQLGAKGGIEVTDDSMEVVVFYNLKTSDVKIEYLPVDDTLLSVDLKNRPFLYIAHYTNETLEKEDDIYHTYYKYDIYGLTVNNSGEIERHTECGIDSLSHRGTIGSSNNMYSMIWNPDGYVVCTYDTMDGYMKDVNGNCIDLENTYQDDYSEMMGELDEIPYAYIGRFNSYEGEKLYLMDFKSEKIGLSLYTKGDEFDVWNK